MQISGNHNKKLPTIRPQITVAGHDSLIPKDVFLPGRSPIIGMVDPVKYPDWKPGRKAPDVGPRKETKIPIDSKWICGGDDSPCFYNGQVMTIREAKRLSGEY